MEINIEIIGIERLTLRINKAADSLDEKIMDGLEIIGENIVADAKAFAPIKTGRLRNSIGKTVFGRELEVYAEAEYAAYVEYGTSRMRPQPFLRPAFEANRADLITVLKGELREAFT